jgi:DNA-binding LacI/PurR family transcriptional regulator
VIKNYFSLDLYWKIKYAGINYNTGINLYIKISMNTSAKQPNKPIYEPLLTRLRSEIKTGRIGPGEFVGTEYEFTRQTGYSRVSIRRAIGKLIDEGLVVRRTGKGIFVREPHVVTQRVEIVVPDMGCDAWVKIVRGAQRLGAEHGIQIHLYDAHSYGDLNMAFKFLEKLPEFAPGGAILGTVCHPRFAELVYKLKILEYPFVLLDSPWRDIEIPTVCADNHAGAYAIGKELIRLGHRRIGYIGPLVDHTARTRLEGLRDAVNDMGFSFDRALALDLVLENPLTTWEIPVDRCVRELMNRPDPPTAIFACTDGAAADSYRTLKSLGYSVPTDVSVVGFDDEPFCRFLDPQLTTVRQPTGEMGKIAMDMLLKRMKDPRGPVENCILPVEFIKRGSIAEARTK